MKKKEYKVPAIKVANLDCSDIICTSGEGSSTENIGRGPWWETEPDKDSDGYVWVDAKGQGAIGDAW